MPEIRTAVRTGDTLMQERRAMLKRPPHILVTTPESLYILLTAESSRAILRDVETVIVDEIHAVADDKRGAHLALSLERLEALAATPGSHRPFGHAEAARRDVAHFLTGSRIAPTPAIVQHRPSPPMDLAVEVPRSELGPVATNEMWDEIYDRIAELALQHRSTLVFVNTRRLAERVAMHLGERLGEDAVAAHHGSLSRKLRLAAERKLKNGEIRAAGRNRSLELGIDIGTVDLVCQIGSPRSIAVACSASAAPATGAAPSPKAASSPPRATNCWNAPPWFAPSVRAIWIVLHIPEAPLDILAQQIVAVCAAEDWERRRVCSPWCAAPIRIAICSATEFRPHPVEMLSRGHCRQARALWRLSPPRPVNRRLRARRGARLAAITSGGAIPDNALFTVVAQPEGSSSAPWTKISPSRAMRGDIILLGNTSWRIRRVAVNAAACWWRTRTARRPRSVLARRSARAHRRAFAAVADLREQISSLLPNTRRCRYRSIRRSETEGRRPRESFPPARFDHGSAECASRNRFHPEVQTAVAWLNDECGLDDPAPSRPSTTSSTGPRRPGRVPTQQTIIAERFFDEGGGMQLVIHAPFGARINKAWGLALRKRFCRSFNFELQAAATDNGLNISLGRAAQLSARRRLPLPAAGDREGRPRASRAGPRPSSPRAGAGTPTARWRCCAFRAARKFRRRSSASAATIFSPRSSPMWLRVPENIEGDIAIPDHPLVNEVMKDVLTEAMDVDGLRAVSRTASAAARSAASPSIRPCRRSFRTRF